MMHELHELWWRMVEWCELRYALVQRYWKRRAAKRTRRKGTKRWTLV